MPIRVRAVIIDNNKLLVLKRNKEDGNFYCFLGGGVEKGESEKQALERESKEEANIQVKVGKKVWQQDFKGSKINFYKCKLIGGEVGKGDGPEYQKDNVYIGTHEPTWLDIGRLKKYDLRPHDLRDAIIEENGGFIYQ